jgi:hypothetical protein
MPKTSTDARWRTCANTRTLWSWRSQGATAIATHDYPTRWAHVHAASELRHPAALPFLRNLILTPIPPEESPDPHSFSTVGEETILRTTAVEGIGYLARGRADATEMLFEALRQLTLDPTRGGPVTPRDGPRTQTASANREGAARRTSVSARSQGRQRPRRTAD